MADKLHFYTDKYDWKIPTRDFDVYVWDVLIGDHEASEPHFWNIYVLANSLRDALGVAETLCFGTEGDTVISCKQVVNVALYAAPNVITVSDDDMRSWQEAHGRPKGDQKA